MKVKVLSRLFNEVWPAKRPISGFEFDYDQACREYDWLVVFDEFGRDGVNFETLACPRERTILCTWEPVTIKGYSRAYTRQFGHLLTNRPPSAERHPNYHLGRGYFIPFVHAIPPIGTIRKERTLSAVCSAKQMKHTRHHERYRLLTAVAREVPDFDWFGKGVRPLAHKEDALLPYRYHLAVENHIGERFWTEKLPDAFLCECLPFYAGDPLISEVFPRESYIPIPIDDPAEAVRIVRAAIASDEYSRRREAVLEAKRLVVEKYNFRRQVMDVIESCGDSPVAPSREPVRIYTRRALRWHDPVALLEDGWLHVCQAFGGLRR